jgi:hypothetical protein
MKRPNSRVDNGLKAQCHDEMLSMICIGVEKLATDRQVPVQWRQTRSGK